MSETTQSSALPIVAPATWKDYLALTKPRVISLLLFTALAAMFVVNDGQHHVTLLRFVAVLLGGYAAAGAANTINMVWDRDIDGKMGRTSGRPTVTEQISAARALGFAALLELFSFVLLMRCANLLAALMALSGLLFYVFIYTMLLKRRTWHNIVIGGAAGAFPPLVGAAATYGQLTPMAWLMFWFIFVWTPVHFWALALLIRDEYAGVGVPMLPVVKGDKATVQQIMAYAVVTVASSYVPCILHWSGVFYFVSAAILNIVLALKCLDLSRKCERKQASGLFHYSMIYLALVFLFLAIDHAIVLH
jgi:heme o synthase